ncbi:SAM-dependent methyltransferase [Jhaorihella thermophila]|uniref:Cyclopropane-fatty-acyl-phospholipid synthase n=1 Tax=Jhaorihella thermophila TaxID=488547 RepID=A0A1H5YQU2_9RHOB|nr:cyclopropane-fatty-acyl-phospholipid synthase family protein [Jhaorihella thermophila]SEG25726.1 cyclopropane-fatty-acyl-phospholipid synthase [Jhaorihella thermophila]
MWETVFHRMISQLIHTGQLVVTYPDGRETVYGPDDAPAARVRITDRATIRALCLNPELALGEGYMDGTILPENDDLEGLLRVLMRNRQESRMPAWVRWATRLRYFAQTWILRNTESSAQRNVAHHYDISDDLYRMFLDEDMQYSCAYFAHPDMTLEEAQAAKKAHIAAKLRIEPGMRVLDIGCGWGGMAMTLARDCGARVTGVTLSENQLATARRRADAAGLSDRIDFRLQDYRTVEGPFDRIVSVGMLEHVGVPHYGEYFGKVADLLEPDGIALIHTIGACSPPFAQSRWITKYIFPGGYIPSMSELAGPIERAGLWNYDVEVLRLHYAMTLRHWLARFDAHLDEVRRKYDERFVRMWRYYLIACYMTFEEDKQAVFQFQLGKRIDALPITRDYLYAGEDRIDDRKAAE